MRFSRVVVHISARPARRALLRSRALVASAEALVRGRRIRRPKSAGGSNAVDKSPCGL